MHASELLSELRTRGVTLHATPEGIRYEAPRGALTPQLRAAVAAHKAELLALLTEPERLATFDADTGELAAVLLRNTVVGNVWLVADDIALADNRDIATGGLPVFFFFEVPQLQRLDAEGLRAVAAVKRAFPTARVLQ